MKSGGTPAKSGKRKIPPVNIVEGRNTTAVTNPQTDMDTNANTAIIAGEVFAGRIGKVQTEAAAEWNGEQQKHYQATHRQTKNNFKGGTMAQSNSGSNKGQNNNNNKNNTTAWTKNKTGSKMNWDESGGNIQKAKNADWQSGNTSCNNMTEFAEEMCKLNDADIVSDVLATQKGLVKMYGTALCEVDCDHLRNILNSQLSESAEDQFDSFLYMNERGLYPTEQAPAPKIKQAKKLFASKEQSFDM